MKTKLKIWIKIGVIISSLTLTISAIVFLISQYLEMKNVDMPLSELKFSHLLCLVLIHAMLSKCDCDTNND